MLHSATLISTITVSLSWALVMGILANRLKLPTLIGYLLAGFIVGPFTPGFVANIELSAQLAEIGVILLMFGVGLHFSLNDLLSVWRIAVPGAIAQIVMASVLGACVARLWGWTFEAGLVFGLSLSVASTVVLLRALDQRGALQSVNGRIAVGWLLVEDVAMVLILVLLPALAASGRESFGSLLSSVGATLGKVAAFTVFMLAIGRWALPRLLWFVAHTGSRELFTLGVIALALGVAYGSAQLFNVSFALGAFFAGMVMRESALSHRAGQESLPLRDAFSVLFFVSIGMLFDPSVLLREPLKVLAVVAIIVVGKSLAAFFIVLAFRYPLNTALTVSASLAQIGEFSFILAGFGASQGFLPKEGESLVLCGALISISINHLVFRLVEPAQAWIRSQSSLARALERSDDPLAQLPRSVSSSYVTGHVVLAGYGRVGRKIAESLAKQGLRLVVIDQNRELIEALREQGMHAVAGDAAEAEVLIQAHVARARFLVVAVADTPRARRMSEVSKMLNPDIHVLIRTHDEEDAALLREKRAGVVFMGEHELAFSMARHVMLKNEGA